MMPQNTHDQGAIVGRNRAGTCALLRLLRLRAQFPATGNEPMPDTNEEKEQQLERRYRVRQVTNIQASWTEKERGRAACLRCSSSSTTASRSTF